MHYWKKQFKVWSIKFRFFRKFEPIFQIFRLVGQTDSEGKVLSGRLKSLICGLLEN